MEVVEFGRLGDAQRAELEGDEEDPFDAAGNTLQWRSKDQHVALRGDHGRLVASAGLVLAEVEVGNAPPIPVVGIGGVLVSAPYRGRGLGNRVIIEVLARAKATGRELALLFCHRNRAGLYKRHGFVEIPPPVLVEQPDGPVEIAMVSMWRPLREGWEPPAGQLVLRSFPF
ncbi:MAG TPA: GNAT family N-acetyltransferase [Solirubrobacteraceae bacterium]|jgi:GNAT superfamily N-acetyltransferase